MSSEPIDFFTKEHARQYDERNSQRRHQRTGTLFPGVHDHWLARKEASGLTMTASGKTFLISQGIGLFARSRLSDRS